MIAEKESNGASGPKNKELRTEAKQMTSAEAKNLIHGVADDYEKHLT
jgi:hypothetical protein